MPVEQHLMISDLVWIDEESNASGYYPTARIEELREGSKASPAPHTYTRRPYDSSVLV